jgi:hypothetical protein
MVSDKRLRQEKAEHFPGAMNLIQQERWLRLATAEEIEVARGASITGEHSSATTNLITKELDRRILESARDAATRSIPAPWYRNWSFWLMFIAAVGAVIAAIPVLLSWLRAIVVHFSSLPQ